MAFKTPVSCSTSMKPALESSWSTLSFQPNDVLNLNLNRMRTGKVSPRQMARSGMVVDSGAQDISVAPCSNDSQTQFAGGDK